MSAQTHCDGGREAYRVGSYNPLWRWAVALEAQPDLAALPFFGKRRALRYRREIQRELPGRRLGLLRRRPFRRVVDVWEVTTDA